MTGRGMVRVTTHTKISSFLVVAAISVWGQGVVQVSSVTAEPAKLDCSRQLNSKVTAQVYFYGIDTQAKPVKITVTLSPYSATPEHNEVQIPDPRKEIELRESPGIAQFDVSCAYDTRPGVVKVSATIVSVPANIKIQPPDADNFVGTLTIQDSASHP